MNYENVPPVSESSWQGYYQPAEANFFTGKERKYMLGLMIVIVVLLWIPLFDQSATWAKEMNTVLLLALGGIMLGQIPSVLGQSGQLMLLGLPLFGGFAGLMVGSLIVK